jgi:hypothetical protein
MKPTIYFLDDQIGKGRAQVIRALTNRLILEATTLNLVVRPLDIQTDLVYVIEADGLSIGLMSHENEEQRPADLIRFLEEENCQLIFCSSAFNKDLNKAIADLVVNKKYQSIYLKSAFSSLLKVDQLLNYEVSKLLEIIKISIEYASSKETEQPLLKVV